MSFNSVTGKDETEELVGIQNPVPNFLPKQNQTVDKTEDFLKIIEQIESSGGKNTNHPIMKAGIHEGDAAIGRFGLMPNTLEEIYKRSKLEGTHTPEMSELMRQENLKEQLESNPELEKEFARRLAERVLSRFPSSEQAAYSWNQGHNLTPEQVRKRDYKNADYVKKFQKIRSLLGK